MATDIEKLVVQLSADIRSYENAMAKATGVTKSQLKSLKAEAANAGAASGAAFTGAASGVAKFGASAGAATGNVRALTRQTNALQGQTGNLAAQFQDIAVQLQSGTSPFTIALQQGTQINQVFGGMGARGAVAALGGALTSLINPISLATIGIIALGGLAIQYFSTLTDDGEKSAEELKEQAALIKKVADEWGAAVPAVKAYADEFERTQRIEDLQAAGLAVIQDIWEKPRQQVSEYADQIEAVIFVLQSLGDTKGVADLRAAFERLQDGVADETATAEDAKAVQDALNAVMAQGGPIAESLAASMGALAGSLDSASNSAAQAQSQINGALNAMRQFREAEAESRKNLPIAEASGAAAIKEMERQNSLTKEQIALETEVARVKDDVAKAGGIIDPATANRLAEQTLAAERRRSDLAKAETAAAKKSGGGGGRDKAASEADREAAAVVKLIEALQFEQSLIGLTDLEREKANALRRAGSAATAEQRSQIEALVSASYAEVEALKATEDQMERLKGLSKDVLGGMFEDMRDGVKGADLLANALNRVAESFANAGIDALIDGMFAGGARRSGGLFGGRFIPGILHKGGIVGSDGYDTGRTVSPSVFLGAKRFHGGGVVGGLRPGEVPIIAQAGERVIPKGGGGGSSSRIEVVLSQDLQARILDAAAGHAVRISQASAKDTLNRVPATMAKSQFRGSNA